MNSPEVIVIDYGIGNVFSVCRAVEQLGGIATLTSDPSRIREAPRVILPGVGAFKSGMDRLRDSGLDDVVTDYATSGRPLLGICLGMQMLMERSSEFGNHSGLGIVPGAVDRISVSDKLPTRHKIPHVAWSKLLVPLTNKSNVRSAGHILNDCFEQAYYFVHSFAAVPERAENVLAEVEYGGSRIVAAVGFDNVVGVQFHPERSASAGLQLLDRFMALS